jgi:hypothetical protein
VEVLFVSRQKIPDARPFIVFLVPDGDEIARAQGFNRRHLTLQLITRVDAERFVGGVIIGNPYDKPLLFSVRYRLRALLPTPARQDFIRQFLNLAGVCVGVRARRTHQRAD